jgi:hypothetical protein
LALTTSTWIERSRVQHSVVSMVTLSGLDGPGLESRWKSRPDRPRGPRSLLRLKCDGTRAKTRFRLSTKRTSPFKSAGASVQSTTGSRGVRISGSNARYTMFRGSVKSTGYPLHSPVSLSLPLPCVTVCHHISTGLYSGFLQRGKAAGVWCCSHRRLLAPRL